MKRLLFILCLATSPLFATNLSPVGFVNAAVTNTCVKVNTVGAAPSQLISYNIANPTSSFLYVQFFDVAATGSVTLGTTAPAYVIAVPPYGVTDAFVAAPQFTFFNGIVIAATTTATGNTAPSVAASVTLSYE